VRIEELSDFLAKLSRLRPNIFGFVAGERFVSLFAVFVRERNQSGGYCAVASIACW
jgi:hypothetical protein